VYSPEALRISPDGKRVAVVRVNDAFEKTSGRLTSLPVSGLA